MASQNCPDLTCPYCGHVSEWGKRVCLGCNSDITYGAVESDFNGAGFALVFLVVVLGIPACNVVAFYGNPRHARFDAGLACMILIPAIVTGLLYYWKARRLRSRVRFFRR